MMLASLNLLEACPAGDQNTLFQMHSRYFAVGDIASPN